MAQEKDIDKILVLTEVDHKKLTMRKAMQTANAADWSEADATEIERFLAIKGVKMIHHNELPFNTRPRNVVKVLEHKMEKGRRVRAAYNGSPIKGELREQQYSTYSSDHLAKKIFFAALATRSKNSNARLATLDLESFYLHERNVLPRTDYFYYDVSHLPERYKLKLSNYTQDNRVLMSCTQAIYGMWDAGNIAGSVLAKTLTDNNYLEIENTCLWVSKKVGEEDLLFNTNVDDFAIIHVPQSNSLLRLEKVLRDVGYSFVRSENNQARCWESRDPSDRRLTRKTFFSVYLNNIHTYSDRRIHL